MKITGLELFAIPPRLLFLKVSTDEGISGWGEPIVEGHAQTVRAAVHELEYCLIGEDPLRIEYLWQVMYRGGFYRGGPVLTSAISGIDQALWDIKGKQYGVPAYELLGGACRDRIPVYIGVGGKTPEELAENAKRQMEQGYSAVKTSAVDELNYLDSNSKIDAAVRRIAAIRKTCGPDLGIAVDFHGRVHKPMVKTLIRELEPFHLLFIEEPLLSENYEGYREIAAMTDVPIAMGERLYTRWDFKRIFGQGVVNIVQPDLSHAGGLLECRKIAAMAEAYDMAVAPHCPLGPIALAACLQLDACTPNAVIQEQSVGVHTFADNPLLSLVKNHSAFRYRDGSVALPEAPGLGIEIDEENVRALGRVGHSWRNPLWHNPDGTVAEW